MKLLTKQVKRIAWLLLLAMVIQTVTPGVSYALTSGPTQPETQGFQPIGNSDMVDLFSGDFSYNIPLFSVGDYPVNLSYQSGSSMDDEASWVGYGWSLNVGALNRQLRGIPDDFNGTDMQEREMSMKNHTTKGGKFSMTLDLLGIPKDKIKKKVKKKKKLNLALTVSVGVKVDNYRGIGMEIGLNPGVSMTSYSAGTNTPDKDGLTELTKGGTKDSPVSGGLTLSSQDGATVNLNAAILKKSFEQNDKVHSITRSIGFGYNSRAGLQGMTLSGSFSSSKFDTKANKFKTDYERNSSSSISFNSDTYTPTIDHATRNDSYSLSIHLGPEVQIALPAIGVSGFYSKQSILDKVRRSPAYGYLNSEKAKDVNDALVDFNREKDIPYSKEVKYLPLPVPTYDLFSASSQDASGQYRLYRGSSGVFFDQRSENKSSDLSLGIEVGAGTYFDVGADIYKQNIKTVTQKWKKRNNFLPKGDFQGAIASEPLYEPAYFKRVGEPVPNDADYVSMIKGTSPVAVNLPSKLSNAVEGAEASDKLRSKAAPNGTDIEVLRRHKREVRNTTFSYLTAKEAALQGLDKTINDYNPDSLGVGCSAGAVKNTFPRVGDYRKSHHFSEVRVTSNDGKISVFGLPVYNTRQEEVSFSVTENLALRNKGLINYDHGSDNSVNNSKGRENYYSKETTPPYATSYLLTGILSPDYVDVTGNGITDDDLGGAVKFNYTRLDNIYKWRTPFAFGQDTANYNEGFLSEKLDDKANYVYGEKEIWYLHSIESKTLVAHFITEDRNDGLGVTDNRGGVNTSVKLKRLKEIRLYSKSDLQLHGNNPALTIPIKVVHLVHNYSICTGLPNSIDNVGKLTLESVYFTFGQNDKGKLNPYSFEYNTSSYNSYNYRQYDRWGNFKDAAANPNGLNNSEFPYTIQDTISNQFVSAWQLKKITLPTGGTISITYESDDYAFVEDRRASQMCMMNGVGSAGSSTGLINADYLYVNLPYPVSSNQELRERYFEGIQNLYYKFLLDLDGKQHKEFVPGYAELDPAVPPVLAPGTDDVAKIKIKKISGVNSIARAGWQFMRTSLPRYAYPGSDNLEDDGSNLAKAIKALVAAFGSIKELIMGFEKRAKNKGFSNTVDLTKSWVRLCSPQWKKYGGGSRVKRISVSDEWAEMSETSGAKTATYTQLYDYTTKDPKGRTISSGVASYEPLMGNDENPFRQPIRYKQNQFLSLDNYYYIEEPFGESFFQSARVGYSKVTVKTIGSGDDESVNRSGVTVSEFYTAKDYPTKVDILGLQDRKPLSSKLFKLIGGISYDIVGLSQGYSIELNDMHGKQKSINIFNKAGQNISSVEYFYQSVNEKAEKKELRNNVKAIDATGIVTDGTVGVDAEIFTDMRQETCDNLGISLKISGGSGAIFIFPLPFFFPGIGVNYDRRSFRSSSTVKVINRFAIQYKVRKIENGSSVTSENLLWDAETGNVLLTKTQNEFDDPVYSFAYPAHWKYEGMAQAYQNIGAVFTDFSTGGNGQILNSSYEYLLNAGDELVDFSTGNKYWVVNSPVSNFYQKRIIDQAGAIQTVSGLTVKVLRSGRRNMANTAIATITSLKSPIIGNQLILSEATKVLEAKATVFNEEWSMPVKINCTSFECIDGCELSSDSSYCYKYDYRPALDSLRSNISGSFCHSGHPAYNWAGTYIYDSSYMPNGTGGNPTLIDMDHLFWRNSLGDTADGPLNRAGVWSCPGLVSGEPSGTFIGFTVFLNVPATKTYYIGISADNFVRLTVNDTIRFETFYNTTFYYWHVLPIRLHAGTNSITLLGNNEGGPASFGAEVYDNTAAQIDAAQGYDDLNLIFSTSDITGRNFQADSTYALACPTGYDIDSTGDTTRCRKFILCSYPGLSTGEPVNPYYTGMLGNWRPQSQYVYHVSRENIPGNPSLNGSTDIRKSGAYSLFSPFWVYESWVPRWSRQNPYDDPRWVEANRMTYFNSKGQEIENKDALDRYSAALFGYLESLPVAVVSNSRYREAAYDGFEDYGFVLDCSNADTCNNSGHFNFRKKLNSSTVDTTSLYAHTGKYSLKLNGSVSINKTAYLQEPVIFTYADNGGYLVGSNELAKGFSPIPGKKYILSFWVKDSSPRNASTNVQAIVNGSSLVEGLSKWPVVEGWKRIEVPFLFPLSATNFTLELQSGGGNVYIDDIRIHPYESQMKSFAYDASTQRMMAELDENNFAAFYEYDEEGTLIRVKKETERGIMTIKETRSGFRKR